MQLYAQMDELRAMADALWGDWRPKVRRGQGQGGKAQHRRAFALNRVLGEPSEPCDDASPQASPTSQGYSGVGARKIGDNMEVEIDHLARADGWESETP
jgi:hypothetical protein